MSRLDFGRIDKLPSGNHRARYLGPDGELHKADATFPTRTAAKLWLTERQAEIASGKWRPPAEVEADKAAEAVELAAKQITLGSYARTWLDTRTNSRGEPLRIRTRTEYERLLRAPGTRDADDPGGPLAELLPLVVGSVTAATVRDWRAKQMKTGTKTQTSRAYGLLKAIMTTALEDQLIPRQPCTIKGGSHTSTGKAVVPPTDEELEVILATIKRDYLAMVLIAAVGGLRYGEVTALQASDVTVERDDAGAVHAVRIDVNKQVVWVTGKGGNEGEVKALASNRNVAIFGDDARTIADHVKGKIGQALLFPAVTDPTGYLHGTTFHRHWAKAREAAGRSDLTFHALRHYAGTSYAQAGATLKETMARLGHSSPQAAMRYQHAGNRDDELAARLARKTTAG